MALTIAEQKGTFYLKGNLNSSPSNLLSHHLKFILSVKTEIAINSKILKKDNQIKVSKITK